MKGKPNDFISREGRKGLKVLVNEAQNVWQCSFFLTDCKQTKGIKNGCNLLLEKIFSVAADSAAVRGGIYLFDEHVLEGITVCIWQLLNLYLLTCCGLDTIDSDH